MAFPLITRRLSSIRRRSFSFLALSTFLVIAPGLPASNNDPLTPTEETVEPSIAWAGSENLALGKEVIYSRKPDRLANRGNDDKKLTDGRLSPVSDDELWNGYQREVAAWNSASLGVTVLVDLGAVKDVGKLATRFSGGKPAGGVSFPTEITILGSEDGVQFYNISRQVKVTEGERSLADANPVGFYFRSEEANVTTMRSFVFQVNRRARFVGFSVKSTSPLLAIDEIALLAAEAGEDVLPLTSGEVTTVNMGGTTVVPQSTEIAITTNVITPNWFYVVSDQSPKAKGRYRFQLPGGVAITPGKKLKAWRDEAADGINEWIVEGPLYNKIGNNMLGPLFFSVEKGVEIAADATATLRSDDNRSQPHTVALRTVEIPAVPALKHFDISLGWTREAWVNEHPDFISLYKQCGFNAFPVFPFYYGKDQRLESLKERVALVRAAGLKVVAIDNPIQHFRRTSKKNREIMNIVNGKPGTKLCPSYTGEYYQAEIKTIQERLRLVNPDYIFYDIEEYRSWTLEEAKECSRCQQAFKASGEKSWNQFLLAQGTRLMRDLHTAMAGSTPEGKDPIVGIYDVRAIPPQYDIFDFYQLYPELIQLGQPHLYMAGDVEKIHARLRQNYDARNERFLVPWLTGGTFGEFPPFRMEQTVLECFLNGARGITYYRYDDMDPMDFYYHALALKRLSPFEDLLHSGHKIDVLGSNEKLTYSAFGNSERALLLVGNYAQTPETTTTLSFGNARPTRLHDVIADKELPLSELEHFVVQPEEHRLVEVVFEKGSAAP